jgi:aromatic ring-opening dioxygenase catalytic subunit (LigB family)
LILSGGVTIHTFDDFHEWQYESSSEAVKQFEREIINASLKETVNSISSCDSLETATLLLSLIRPFFPVMYFKRLQRDSKK